MSVVKVEALSFPMTKDAFFYSFKQQIQHETEYAFLESGRGGHYSIAAIKPFATAASQEDGLHVRWQSGRTEVRKGEALAQLEMLIDEYK
ncbi:MAG: aminodeoxychorismate synthase component I, partial [Lysinibacillus sp.]